MDRIEQLHNIMDGVNYNHIVLNYFDQLMSTYNLLKPYNYSISVVDTSPTSIILDLHFQEVDANVVQTLSLIPSQNVTLYNREFEIQILDCKADILRILINERLGSS